MNTIRTPTRVEISERITLGNAFFLVTAEERRQWASGSLLADLVACATISSVYSAAWTIRLKFLVQEPLQASLLPLLWDVYEELIMSSGGGAIRDARTESDRVTAVIGQVTARISGALVIFARNGEIRNDELTNKWKTFFRLGGLSTKKSALNKTMIYQKLSEIYGENIFPRNHANDMWGMVALAPATTGFSGHINVEGTALVHLEANDVLAPAALPERTLDLRNALFMTATGEEAVAREGLTYTQGVMSVSFEGHNIRTRGAANGEWTTLFAGVRKQTPHVNPEAQQLPVQQPPAARR